MRKELLLTCSIMAVAAGGAQAGDLYASVFGGMNISSDASRNWSVTSGPLSLISTIDTDISNGFVVGGSVGVELSNWLEGLRAEMEISYRRNSLKGDWNQTFDVPSTILTVTDETASGTTDGHLSRFAVMANVWYDIDAGSKIVPYVGGGIGWNRARLEVGGEATDPSFFIPTIDPQEFSESGFAWQLGAGANYEVSPGVKVGVGYRYFNGADVDRAFSGKNAAPTQTDEGNHAIQANVTVDLN